MTQPDAPFAAGADPDAPATEPPADRWVRFDGPDPQAVIGVGDWQPGDVKHVPGWLAERLLTRADFTEADGPDGEQATDEGMPPAKASRRRGAAAPESAEPASDDTTA